ncbi:T9SS type A sorting domain-containing protein [Dyadobacter pollutisoli]|uniref:T9SS type A sorting domain-containing protein n=1 Tax=Dyadobacter pollutisoli TaxID=2910158 RepID=A0A9E8NDP1_9BACT|nr:T9SS type A sorting domain-containing protein [Dyadobacter pollutisoli]WAC14830.1 T9SS type A sorting domain-containing protein [Dyadobacter pollutisoli]
MEKTAPASLRCGLLFSLLGLVLSAGSVFAQTTWTGIINTDWNTAGNWSSGVPVATSDVTIPNVTNDPVISSAGALAKSVNITVGGLLTVQVAGSLAINGSSANGLQNGGTVENSGTINITNVSGEYGIDNLGTFSNKTGGLVTIDNVGFAGIFNDEGVFTNEASIKIGSTGGVGAFGINSAATFNNTATGQITIDRAWQIGFSVHIGTTTNQGSIIVGASGATNVEQGINVYLGTFANGGGQITLDRCGIGISGFHANGKFLNNGTLKIGALQSVADLIGNEEFTALIFTNNTGGILQGTGKIPAVHFVAAGGTLSPGYSPGKQTINGDENLSNGILAIEVNGAGVAGTDYDQVVVNGTATLGGTLALSINYTPTVGDQITILSGSGFTGAFGTVTGLPANWTVQYTPVSVMLIYGGVNGNVWNGSVSSEWHDAANWSVGVPDPNSEVTIPDVANDPVIYAPGAVAKSVIVKSDAVLTVTILGALSVNGALNQGVWNQGTIQNNGTINIGNTGNVGNYGIYNEGVLNNNIGARIKINRVTTSGIALSSNTVTNSGDITIGALTPISKLITAFNGQFNNNTDGVLMGTGEIAAANFTNAGGTLSPGYSPGKLTFTTNENFSNNILVMEVNGKGTAGVDFDQVIVSGTATLGGTLSLSVNYPATIGDQIVIVSATQVTGTFASLVGIPVGWHVVYYPTAVVLIYGTGQATWTGVVDVDWNNAANWSSGIPDISSDVTIPDVANDPVIGSGAAVSKSVTIATGGVLTVEGMASLTIQNSNSQGLLNQGTMLNRGTTVITGTGANGLQNGGTVENSGTINITNVSGEYGIDNLGTFSNKTGGLVTIDNVGFAGIFNDEGVFTNEASIKIGSTGGVGAFGINSAATFNNTATGQITIDRAWQIGFSVHIGTTTNQGSIIVGASGATNVEQGIDVYLGTFANDGGQITLDRCGIGISGFHANGKFLNNGTLKIGALQSVADLIGNEDLMALIFTNNAGGVLQGTGKIPAAYFVAAGGTLSPGYSPGKQTIDGDENLSNGILAIEVNGTGVAGTAYDQVVVNGTATLGGTLALTFNFPAPNDGDVVTIIDATAISGTFSSVTGLPEHWDIKYNSPNSGEVSLEYTNNLPVTLVRFTAKKQDNSVKLDWQTSEEIDNQGFEVERRLDSGMWEKVGFVDGNGTTKENNTYSFLDLLPLHGMNYYRLRQLDFDGKVELSRIVGVKMDSGKLLKIYPNPTTGIINIEGTQSNIRILDILGRPVMTGTIVNQKLDVSHLPGGFYILSVSSENNVKSIPIVKQ